MWVKSGFTSMQQRFGNHPLTLKLYYCPRWQAQFPVIDLFWPALTFDSWWCTHIEIWLPLETRKVTCISTIHLQSKPHHLILEHVTHRIIKMESLFLSTYNYPYKSTVWFSLKGKCSTYNFDYHSVTVPSKHQP